MNSLSRAFSVVSRAFLSIASEVYFSMIHQIFAFINIFIKKRIVPRPVDGLLLISATNAAKLIRLRQLSSVELVEAYIKRIEEVNEIINAVVLRNFEEALAKARKVDELFERLVNGSDEYDETVSEKPLLGVPFTLKDCIETKSLICTIGLASRKDSRADEDAVVVKRMKEAGAIVLAVTNVPELALWWESANTIHGRTLNPYDTRRIVGGSSGGEAALISSAGSIFGIGSDIGGSIRIPSNFNGVFGLKPSPGVVPLEGHLPSVEGEQSFMLRIGPICRYAEDLPLMLGVMAGEEWEKKLELNVEVSLKNIRVFYMEGLKILLTSGVSRDCNEALKKAVRYFETKFDVCAVRLDLSFAQYAIEFFISSMKSESNGSFALLMTDGKFKLDCRTELFRWLLGLSSHTLPSIVTGLIDQVAFFTDSQKQKLFGKRGRLLKELTEILKDDAILLFPSFPTVAPFHHEPLLTPLNFVYTGIWNTLPFPVVQCPMGLNGDNIPIGVQLIGGENKESLLISAAKELESGFGGWKPAI